jgi:intraflagellar transport protein 80
MTQMMAFFGAQITIRRKDGGLVNVAISPYPSILFEFCEKQRWEKAIRLCRFVKEQTLWACLAAVSLNSRELNTAEIALAAVESIDKVQFVNKLKELPSEASRNAQLALYFHKTSMTSNHFFNFLDEAEQILLQAKLYYRAIKLNIKLFRWDRALEIATNQKSHIETVLGN